MKLKAIGTTDDVTTCECCGKPDLKSTVALVEVDEDGNEVGAPTFYGSTCAARAAGRPVKEIRVEAKRADDEARELERLERERKAAEEYDAWASWLEASAPSGSDVFTRIEALGGYAAARAAYEARR